MKNVERPRLNQQVTAILVRDQGAEVGTAKILGVDRTSVVLEMATEQASQYEGHRVTLIYLVGERVMHWKTKCAAIVDGLRWALVSEGDPTEGERRDFFRTTMEVGIALRRGLNDDPDEAYVALMDEGADTVAARLSLQEADISGSGIKFVSDEIIPTGETFGLLVALPSISDRVYGVVAEAIRAKPDGTACTFTKISEEFQDLIIASVFQSRYDNLIS
jgi:hypothetical protein